MQQFMTRYHRPKATYEPGGGDLLVERAGYIPPKKQIEQFMLAGKRLEASRRELFDFPDGKDTGEFDPTRSPNFDMADASQLMTPAAERVKQGIQKIKEERKAKNLAQKEEFEAWKKSQENSKNSKTDEPEGSKKD